MAFTKATKKGYDTTTWDKESQKVLEGVYVEYKTELGGKPGANIYVIENEGGRWAVWENKLLSDYFSEMEFGTKVRLTFKGKVKTKSGVGSFNDYDVEIDNGK